MNNRNNGSIGNTRLVGMGGININMDAMEENILKMPYQNRKQLFSQHKFKHVIKNSQKTEFIEIIIEKIYTIKITYEGDAGYE